MPLELYACLSATRHGYLPLEDCRLFEVRDAAHATVERLRYRSADEYFVDLAVASLIDADPIHPTPRAVADPGDAAGFAVGAVNVPDPELRILEGIVHATLDSAVQAARAGRAARDSSGVGPVFDIVALTIVDADRARSSA